MESYTEISGITERCKSFDVCFDDPDAVEKMIDLAIADAVERLPSGEMFEIRTPTFPPDVEAPVDYGRRMEPREYFVKQWCVSWYWSERMQNSEPQPRVRFTKALLNELGGFNLVARLVV